MAHKNLVIDQTDCINIQQHSESGDKYINVFPSSKDKKAYTQSVIQIHTNDTANSQEGKKRDL